MAEWSIATVLKTVDCQRSGGSNPSLSARQKEKVKEKVKGHSNRSVFFLFFFLFLFLNHSVMFPFQNLELYKKAQIFHLGCKKLLGTIKSEKYVNDQLGRASYSIVLNIAEGSAKISKADRKNYFTTARGSLFECVAILDLFLLEQIIQEDTYKEHLLLAEEISRILYSMIKNLSV